MVKLRPQAVGHLLSASYLLAWLQGRAGIERADVAAKRVTSVMHPVIHCEWPRWNDGVWCLIYQPLIVTCCMPYRPLHYSKQHSQHHNCSQVVMVSLDKAGVRQPMTNVTKRQRNSSICVPNVGSLHCHYARSSLQFADHFGRSDYAAKSI